MFAFRDGKTFPKDAKSKLSPEVKAVFEKCLAVENTQALMFMFGHYLPFFHAMDPVWMRALIPEIFPAEAKKKDLYLAAWEGYLTRSLSEELFEELKGVYVRAIDFDPEEYTPRRYFGELDSALAGHLALAFMHFKDFDFNADLFKHFWQVKNTKRYKEFVSFIGRHTLSRERPAAWIKEHEVDIEKVKSFWDWALEHCNDPEVLGEFGFWMKNEDGILDPHWLAEHIVCTLEQTGGNIHWELGMMQSLPQLAQVAPQEALQIIRLYLTGPTIPNGKPRAWLHVDEDLIAIFQDLYKNPSTKEGTEKLINDLLPRGNGQFWRLKEVLPVRHS
jgi:hypothetical protein